MNIVVLSQGTDYADNILKVMSEHGVRAHAIVFEIHPQARVAPPKPASAGWLRRVLGRTGSPADRLMDWQRPWYKRWTEQAVAPTVEIGGLINSAEMIDCLRKLAPDYLILAGAGIVSDDVIRTARSGVLNAHPGLLPWVGGVGVVWRALERAVAVGVTAHFVNPGIDRGDVIRRQLVPVDPGDRIVDLRRKAEALSVVIMAEIVADAAAGRPPHGAAQDVVFDYCRLPSPDEMQRLDEAVAPGLAHNLYRRWNDFFGSDTLPPGGHVAPPVAISPKQQLCTP